MKIDEQLTDEAILAELGVRLAQVRLEKNLTQADLAREAGVGVRTVQRLETGTAATQLSGFLRVCRALDLAGRLEVLVPELLPSPIAQLKRHGKRRRRASGSRLEERPGRPWHWGE